MTASHRLIRSAGHLIILVAVLFLASAAPAAADPASLIIAGLASSGITVGVVGTAVIRIAVGVALSALGQALAANANAAPSGGGVRTETLTAGDTTPQSFVLGRYMTAGNLVAPEMSHGVDGDTRYLTRVVDLGDLTFTALDSLIVDGRPVLLDGAVHPTFGAGTAHLDFAGALWCKTRLGAQITADSYLTSIYGSYPERPWQADMIGRGIPHAILTFLWRDTSDAGPQTWLGRPEVSFVVQGIRLYDPRLDTTVGGSGPQRFGDAATHSRSENPVVMIYNILRGIGLPGGFTFGGGLLPADLPFATWAAAMNLCDQLVGSRKRYIAGYEVKIGTPDVGGDSPLDVIDQLLKACAGQIADVGGTVMIRVGGPGLPVKFITDEDILRSSDQELDPFPPLEASHTGVHATHPHPGELWQVKEAPPRYDLAAEARDGQRLIADLQLPAVPQPGQVQQLMAAWLKDDQRHRRHRIVLPPEAILIDPLAVIDWTSPRNGYVGKAFEVGEVGIDPITLSTTLSLREVDPADYDWVTGDEITITPPSLTPVQAGPQQVPGWAVTSATIKDGTGTDRRPALRLGWNAPLPGVTGIRWQVRVAGTGSIVAEGSTQNVDTGYHVVSEGIVRNVAYEARGRLVGPKNTVWTLWLAATAPNVSSSDATSNEVTALLNAAGMAPVEIVGALPSVGNFAGRTVYLTTDTKLYRHTGTPLAGTTGWTAAVPTVDLVGTLNGAQIADGAINTAKFAAGIAPVEIVSALPTTGNVEGRTVYLTTDNKLYRHTGSPVGSAGFTVAVDGGDIVAGSIVAGKIAAGAISATEIAAGAIIASKLAVADFTNLVPDSEISDLGVWPAGTGGEYSIVNPSPSGFFSRGHLRRLFVAGTGERAVLSPAFFTVKGGQEYWWQYQVLRSSGTTMRSVASLYWYNAAGTFLAASTLGSFAANTTSGIQTRNGAVTAPAGAVTARWRWTLEASFTDGQVNFASPEVRPKGGGELIVDGAITANTLATNAVTTDKIAANAITSGKITANAITTGLLAAGAVSADKMAANSITAANAALGNAAVDTLQIKGQAITVPVRAQQGGNLRISSAVTWIKILQLVIDRKGLSTELRFSCGVAGFGNSVAKLAIFRGDTKLSEVAHTVGLNGRAITCSWNYIDWNTGTGTTTYSLRVRRGDKAPYDYDLQIGVRFLSAIQFRR